MRASAKVTSKGQITIPLEVRTDLGIEAGDEVIFYRDLDGRPSIRVRRPLGGAITPMSAWRGQSQSVQDMNAARDAELVRRHSPKSVS